MYLGSQIHEMDKQTDRGMESPCFWYIYGPSKIGIWHIKINSNVNKLRKLYSY